MIVCCMCAELKSPDDIYLYGFEQFYVNTVFVQFDVVSFACVLIPVASEGIWKWEDN